jgi:hypothetical protein
MLPGISALAAQLRTDDAGVTATVAELVTAGALQDGAHTYLIRLRPTDPSRLDRDEPIGPRPQVLQRVVAQALAIRTEYGASVRMWSQRTVAEALATAVADGRSPEAAQAALLRLATDRDTHSPARLSAPGFWWEPPTQPPYDLTDLEEQLDSLDGARVGLQGEARRRLFADALPVTRMSVLTLAVKLAHDQGLLPVDKPHLSTDPAADSAVGESSLQVSVSEHA